MPNMIETLKNLSNRNMIILLSVIVLGIAAMVLLFSWSQKADYQVLYANLADSDAGLIVQRLKEMKAPYQLKTGAVLVPSDRVYDIRLQLASQGLPHGGGVGFEIFDKSDFSATDFVQKLNFRRAMQGELARTIMALAEVEQCRVHLAIPERSLFLRENNSPSASVFVRLKPGRALTQNQVYGVVHLVSSSVEGMNPKDVAVVDNRGELLTRNNDDAVGLSSSQLEYQRNYEKDIEARVMGILEPIAGKDKVRAKVTAAIDFTKVEKREERFDPDGQVVRSEQKTTEKSIAGGTGGVPGVASNLPARAGSQPVSSQSQSQKQNDVINYEISRVTSHVINPSGSIKKLSVAVIVDGTYAAGDGSKEKKYAARSEEDIKHYEELVKRAIGFSAERGDDVRVVNMPFEAAQQEQAYEERREYLPAIMSAAKYLIPLIALILFFLLIIKPLIKTLVPPPVIQPAAPELQFPKTVAEIERGIEPKALGYQANVIEWVKKNPDQAANLVKGWIEER